MAEDIEELEYADKVTDFLRQLPVELAPIGTCAICFEAFSANAAYEANNEPAVRLRCSHVFGSACIEAWLTPENSRNTCPLCRAVLFPALQTYYTNNGSAADQAVMRIAEREPGWTIHDLRAYLRRRLEPDPLITEADVEAWWLDGARFSTHRSLRERRREIALWSQICLYEAFCRSWQMPPFHCDTHPEEYLMQDQMDGSHVDALFHVLVSLNAFGHRFWRVTTRGASTRQVFDLLRWEGYIFWRPDQGSFAPFLGPWTAFRNDGQHYLEEDPSESDLDSLFQAEVEEAELHGSDTVEVGTPRQSEAFVDDPMQDVIFGGESEVEEQQQEERSTPRRNKRVKRNVIIDSDDEL